MFSDKVREIKFDRTNGASKIARNALDVLRFFVQNHKNSTHKEFVAEFRELGRRLVEARPNMAPVQNLVAQIVYEVSTLEKKDLIFAQEFALSRLDKLHKESETAVKKCAELAATIIHDSDCLATCSYSSTVCETFKVAKRQGKRFKVFVAESKTDDNMFCYGQDTATFLKSIGVPVDVFPDTKIYRFAPLTDYVLVGVDSVLCDGSIINGSPTCELALKANECGIPFYSVCETAKANTLSYLGKNVELKKGFDLVPSDLVTKIMTETGPLEANEIVEVMKEKSKFFEEFHIP
ncbi:MAG: hypothetical protein NWF06_08655 [Candidatus Bathyarchaeota archaeon]|nr:hypothetical protein [Candidatus Bathyarchaeum sp.]